MDTELARTFLTVVATGNFVRAAERLHVTQSTVSARIQTLEDQLNCRLFIRNKGGTFLTQSGRQFEPHALILVRTVERMRHEVGIADGYDFTLTIGARFGLWDQFLCHCLPLLRERLPAIAVRAEIGFEPDLMQSLIDGRLNMGMMYTPQSRPGLKVEELFVETLILVTTEPRTTPTLDSSYVYVDWGPEFYEKHRASFPEFNGPALTVGIGWLGLTHILEYGGSGYFPLRLAAPHLDAGRLFRVNGASEFTLPAYLVYGDAMEHMHLKTAIDTLRGLAASGWAEKALNSMS